MGGARGDVRSDISGHREMGSGRLEMREVEVGTWAVKVRDGKWWVTCGKWNVGGKWEVVDGRWEVGGRWDVGRGRWEVRSGS